MNLKRIFWLLFFVILLTGCAKPAPITPEPTEQALVIVEMGQVPWWKTAVFYEIFVRSFSDSNGDGIGDFNGITQKLDYLNDGNPATTDDLGITALWLMPINPSPSYHGYDVVNYYNVNPEYGTMEDFKKLLEEAHKRGIKVIIDLVLNHTSSSHPFFNSASTSESAPYHDWYVWSATNEGDHWHLSGTGPNSEYFYGYFSPQMPDLNYLNPAVTEQMEKVTAFWLENVGVDGFRVDAAKHLIEDGKVLENTQATHDWFKGFYTFYKGINENVYVVGEVSGSDAKMTGAYDKDQMDMIFNFEIASGFVNSANGGAISGVGSAITFIEKDAPDWNFATFLTNHDQNRVMSTLGGNIDKAKVAAALLLTSPGTPFIYYGEEIGMMGIKPDEYIRRPMQWTSDVNSGFTTGKPWEDLGENYQTSNVSIEAVDKSSLLNWYKTLVQLRNANPIFSIGNYIPVKVDNPRVYAALRELDGKSILVIINLSKTPISEYSLSWQGSGMEDGAYKLTSILEPGTGMDLMSAGGKAAGYKPIDQMEAYSIIIFELQKAN
jgi:alpha-amylase